MTPFVQNLTTLISLGVILGDIWIIIFMVFLVTAPGSRFAQKIFRFESEWGLVLGFLISLAAIFTSLLYSNIANFAPCELCWWQRVCIYPQVVIFGLALYKRRQGISEHSAFLYAGGLSVIGTLIAAYHYYGQTFAEGILPCNAAAVSCAKIYFMTFGYITIPVMSLTGFLLLLTIFISRKMVRA